MKILIHYNGYDFAAPNSQDDVWSNYRNPDSAKMFLVCAESWERAGWQVDRLDTTLTKGFSFSGKLHRIFEYPLPLWNLWYAARMQAPCWIVTTDVINYGFTPEQAAQLVKLVDDTQGISLTVPWSNSCFWTSQVFAQGVIDLIYKVDRGERELPKCNIITDEAIIRESQMVSKCCVKYVMNARIETQWQYSQLLHFPRSGLVRAIDSINVTL